MLAYVLSWLGLSHCNNVKLLLDVYSYANSSFLKNKLL